MPPSISRDGAGPWNDEYWICHAACVFDTPKKPKKISEDQCRNESTFHVYNCQCGDLYNARQRLGVWEGNYIARTRTSPGSSKTQTHLTGSPLALASLSLRI